MKQFIFQSLDNLLVRIQTTNTESQMTTTVVPESFCIQLPKGTLLNKKPTPPKYIHINSEVLLPPSIRSLRQMIQSDDDGSNEERISYRGDNTYFDDLSYILKIPTEESQGFIEISPTATFAEIDKACPQGTFMVGFAINRLNGAEILFVTKSREEVKELLESGTRLKDYQNWTWRYVSEPVLLIRTLLEKLNSTYDVHSVIFLDKMGNALNNSTNVNAINENDSILINAEIHPDDRIIEEKSTPSVDKTALQQSFIKLHTACSVGKEEWFKKALSTITEKDRGNILQEVRKKISEGKFQLQKEKALRNFDTFLRAFTLASTEAGNTLVQSSSTRLN